MFGGTTLKFIRPAGKYSRFIPIFSRDIYKFPVIIAIVHGWIFLHYVLHRSKPNFINYRNRRWSFSIATRGRKQHTHSTVSAYGD